MKGRQLGIVILLFFMLMLVAGVVLGFAFGVFDGVLAPAEATPPQVQISTPVIQATVSYAQETDESVTEPALVTATASAVVVESPTATISSPTPSPHVSPTVAHIATITSTPPPSVCSQISLQFLGVVSNVAQWRLQNANAFSLELTRAQIDWPQTNEAFYYIFLDGTMIWSNEDLAPPTGVINWMGTSADRMVDGAERLELLFGFSAAQSGYDLQLWFSNGCQVAASQ
jgi:hypothetical protein